MNKYEELMYKKETDRIMYKGVLALIVIILFIVGAIASLIKTEKEKVTKIVTENFKVVAIHERDDTWIAIIADDSDYDKSFDILRGTYNELSKSGLKKDIIFMVAEDNERGLFRYTSKVSKKELRSTNWNDIKTYDEFKQKANIEQI